nr:PucR family transcriptional regulator [uncultured Treponema sp.]
MALSLQTIFNFTETPFKLKLLAGKKGFKKNVSWVYYTEDAATIEFIRGGELAVTLGVNFERSKDNLGIHSDDYIYIFLKEFIDEFIKHDATGLIINTGKYIKEIPQRVIDYCNEKDFPLLSMPWEVHTIDLMQEIGNMIVSDNQNTNTIERYLYKAIYRKNDFDPNQIANTNFRDAKTFTIMLVDLKESLFNENLEKIKRYVQFNFNARISLKQTDYASFIHNYKVIFILKNGEPFAIQEIFKLVKEDRYFKDSIVSVSDSTDTVEELSEIYEHAKIALEINSEPDKINYYENLGLYKILFDVKNPKILKTFYNENLGKLEELDADKKEDFLKTLALYLKTGGNALKVAELNNAHRNTILYRISRMEEILGFDFSDGEIRTAMQVCLYIRNLNNLG